MAQREASSTVSPASGPDLAASWRRRPGYLDTSTYGLPPRQTVERSHRVIDEWDEGRVLYDSWNDAADEARRLFASFVGVTADAVAVGSATSHFAGLVAVVPAGHRRRRRSGRRVHLAAVPLPRPGRARRRGARSTARGVGRLGGPADDRRGVECGPVVGRAHRRHGGGARGGGPRRGADGRRRHAGHGLAPAAARSRRRRGVLGVQVVVLSARHRLHGRLVACARRLPPALGQLVRR